MIIWLIGLAGAGKSSIGKALFRQMQEKMPNTVLLDGDGVRFVMGNDLGHSIADREKNGWRICRLGKYLEEQGQNVIVCILSNFPEQRAWNREHANQYKEIYIKVPIEVLMQRDQKGLYSKAAQGEIKDVIGMDIPFAEPEQPDLIINNDQATTNFDTIATHILDSVLPSGVY